MRLTKTYPGGAVTLDASQFGINQEVLDTEIRNSEPIKAAVERLKELEDRDELKKVKVVRGTLSHYYCPKCGYGLNMIVLKCYCPDCGQALDWSEA